MVESSASSDVYSLLKREDEKFVTERAYENPMFVEDVVREVASKLSEDRNIVWFTVDSENFESIHNHSAYATSSTTNGTPRPEPPVDLPPHIEEKDLRWEFFRATGPGAAPQQGGDRGAPDPSAAALP